MPDRFRLWEQPMVIVLQQELPVRLVNISRSGCLLHAPRSVGVGTVGRLRVALDDAEYADDVRVARCTSLTGAASELAVELLWVPKPKEPRTSPRSLALRLSAPGDAVAPARPRATDF
jgi:hypothetical protein